MLTPMPGMITSTSSTALAARSSSITRPERSALYGTRESTTQAAAPSPTPMSCLRTAESGSPATVRG